MIQRIISALFIFIVFFVTIFYTKSIFFIILSIVIHIVMLYEWYNMVSQISRDFYIGLIVILFSLISILYLFLYDLTGVLIFNYLCVIWTVDIVALCSGKILRNTKKLAPIISPNKTWAGFLIGSSCAAITIYVLDHCFALSLRNILQLNFNFNIQYQMVFAVFIGVVAQISDLFVSFFKRRFSIKDTGNLIPGHGGFLDRFDSFLFTAPLTCVLLIII